LKFFQPLNIFNVFLIAEHASAVNARGGYSINPHYSVDEHPPIDVLIVAGGMYNEEIANLNVINWISKVAKQATLVSSVCTSAFILAQAGLLSGQTVTTHWEDITDLQQAYPDLKVMSNKRWVDHGSVITSTGISTGIAMSLHLVAKLANVALAEKTARQMEFYWRK